MQAKTWGDLMAVAEQYQSFEPTIEELDRLQAAQLKEKDAQLEKQAVQPGEKDARIEQLKAQLALLKGNHSVSCKNRK